VLLGSAHLARGDGARGAEAYRKILALAPKDPRGRHLVGLALRAQGKAAEARKSFEAALALAQMAKQVAGMAAARTGDKDVAREALAFAAGSPATFKGKDEARKALAAPWLPPCRSHI
jgi:Flp pilus assembly protein TadD